MSHESVWDYLETLANSHTRSWDRGSRGGHDLCLVRNPLPLSLTFLFFSRVCSVRLNCPPTGWICASQLQSTYLSHQWHYAVNHSLRRTFHGVGFFSQLMIHKHTPKNLTHIYLGKVTGANNTWLNTTPKAVFKQLLGSFIKLF